MKKLAFALLFGIFLFSLISAQSIGVSPQKQNIDLQRYENYKYTIIVGNGAYLDEIISITPEEEYSWLEISRNNFEIKSKSQESVIINVNTKRLRNYTARIKFCAKDISSVTGSGLSPEACSVHTLKVNSIETENMHKRILHNPIFWILIVAGIIFGGYKIAKRK